MAVESRSWASAVQHYDSRAACHATDKLVKRYCIGLDVGRCRSFVFYLPHCNIDMNPRSIPAPPIR